MSKMQESILGPETPRFWSKVNVGRGSLTDKTFLTQCWMWRERKDKDGYGIFSCSSGTVRAHIFAYWWHYRIDPKPLYVLHKCNNTSCVNPNHLYAGTSYENMQDRKRAGGYATPSHCPAGHPYVGANAYRYKLKDRPGYGTQCRHCKMLRQREYVLRQKLKEMPLPVLPPRY